MEPWKGRFEHPLDLVTAISHYIKSKMGYNPMTSLFAIFQLSSEYRGKSFSASSLAKSSSKPEDRVTDDFLSAIYQKIELNNIPLSPTQKSKLAASKNVGVLVQQTASMFVDHFVADRPSSKITSYHIKKFEEMIEEMRKYENTMSPQLRDHMSAFTQVIETGDPDTVKDYLVQAYKNDTYEFGQFLNSMILRSGMYMDFYNFDNESNISSFLNEIQV